MEQPERFETGSGGFVWENIQQDELFSSIQLHVYAAFDMVMGKEWSGSQFINHYNRIYYVKSGQATLEFKDFSLTLKPGHMYLIPPFTLLSHSCENELSFMWTHFQARIDAGIDFFMLYGHPCEIPCLALPNIEMDFAALVEKSSSLLSSDVFERNRLLLSLLHPIMCLFDKNGKKNAQLRHQDLLPSLNMINQNISSPPCLKTLAQAAHLSPEHFSRKFKAAFNLSPKRYILQKRVAQAKQLLLLETHSVDAVAEKCGFCDVFHFSRTFKKETGCSPTQFRREYKVQKSDTP